MIYSLPPHKLNNYGLLLINPRHVATVAALILSLCSKNSLLFSCSGQIYSQKSPVAPMQFPNKHFRG